MLIVRKKAEEDIKLSYEWYEAQQKNLGKEFVREIEKKFLEIEEYPELYLLVSV
jgi:plasmid stabilization system protein ParE